MMARRRSLISGVCDESQLNRDGNLTCVCISSIIRCCNGDMALVVMAVAPSGEGKNAFRRDTMVLPGRNTVAIDCLRKSESGSDWSGSLSIRPQADLVQQSRAAEMTATLPCTKLRQALPTRHQAVSAVRL